MPTYTAPTTRASGFLVTASVWNTDIVENIKYFKDAPVFDTAAILGAATTSGIRLDLESGALAVREGDDSAYGPLRSLTLQCVTTLSVGNATPAATGAGVTFPAAQSASSDGNTLDDYEEGSWTPTIGFGGSSAGVTYGTQVGSYVKIGQFVYFQMRLTLTSNGSGTGAALISGLPFAASSTANNYGGMWSVYYSAMSGLSGGVVAFISPSGQQLVLQTNGATATAALTDTNITDTADLIMVGVYRASA